MSQPNYDKLYKNYWSRSDRWGSHSFDDAEVLADQILATCGGGPVLDVGCGMGLIVRTLLRRGVDARGVDVAVAPMAWANERAPDRFQQGSMLELPFDDEAVDTIVSTDVLEHLDDADVPRALSELARVARRYAFISLSTAPDRDNVWHLAIHDRTWWEQQFLTAGFRKHPLMARVVDYESLESEGYQIKIVLEKTPPDALARYPLRDEAGEHAPYGDILRGTGRACEAAIARYTLAANYVRPGDTVVDIGCGGGGGAAILALASSAARVVGVDPDREAIDYARANYGVSGANLEFEHVGSGVVAPLAENSVDVVAVLDPPRQKDSRRYLDEIDRILRPAGRVVLGTGVSAWKKLRARFERALQIECMYAQTVGDDESARGKPRRLRAVAPEDAKASDAEVWLCVGMKDPLEGRPPAYVETHFPDYREWSACNITAFERDYDNPWLVKAMVSIGLRATRPQVLEQMAERTLAQARPGSPDAGAALCVRAYRMLETPDVPATAVREQVRRIQAYVENADESPHAQRWRISNLYVAGRLLMTTGEHAEARRYFAACADLDCTVFSPLLATKTIDALFQAGRIAACANDRQGATDYWRRGLSEAHRVLQGDWRNVWGDIDRPAWFGMTEVSKLADLAARCAHALTTASSWAARPGQSWSLAQTNAEQVHRDQVRMLETQQRYWRVIAEQAQTAADQARVAYDDAQRAIQWSEDQRTNWQESAKDARAAYEQIKATYDAVLEGKQWLETQYNNWKQTAEQRAEHIRRLETRIAALESSAEKLDNELRR